MLRAGLYVLGSTTTDQSWSFSMLITLASVSLNHGTRTVIQQTSATGLLLRLMVFYTFRGPTATHGLAR